jgi:hypothetical protein
VIPNLFGGERGIRLPPSPGSHQEHFFNRPEYDQNFLPLNTAVATQLTLLPIPSPASGFTYKFDRAAGVHTRTAQSFGPILTERGETIGAKKVYLGFAWQRFHFDELDGRDLDDLPVVLPHSPNLGVAFNDIITAQNSVELKIDQFTIFGTVGVTNRFDLSVAVPIMDVRMQGASTAQIVRVTNTTAGDICPPGSPTGLPCHVFETGVANSTVRGYLNPSNPPQSATGIGDVTVRVKQNLVDNTRVALSFLTDVRIPTGDERNFLGSGAVGVKPMFAVTLKGGEVAPSVVFAPHFNIGFQWNGDSVLAGDLAANRKASLPEQLFYAAGTDIGLTRWLTVATDLIGQRVFNAQQLAIGSFTAVNNVQYPQMTFATADFGINNVAVGAKVNLGAEILLHANVLVQLDSGGLRQKIVPMVGLSRTF